MIVSPRKENVDRVESTWLFKHLLCHRSKMFQNMVLRDAPGDASRARGQAGTATVHRAFDRGGAGMMTAPAGPSGSPRQGLC